MLEHRLTIFGRLVASVCKQGLRTKQALRPSVHRYLKCLVHCFAIIILIMIEICSWHGWYVCNESSCLHSTKLRKSLTKVLPECSAVAVVAPDLIFAHCSVHPLFESGGRTWWNCVGYETRSWYIFCTPNRRYKTFVSLPPEWKECVQNVWIVVEALEICCYQ